MEHLTKMINAVYEAVDKSVTGPIVFGKDKDGNDKIKTLAWTTYQIVLGQICPKGELKGDFTMEEKKEKWEG